MACIKNIFHYGCRLDNVFWWKNTYRGAGNENREVTHDIETHKKVTQIGKNVEKVLEVVI